MRKKNFQIEFDFIGGGCLKGARRGLKVDLYMYVRRIGPLPAPPPGTGPPQTERRQASHKVALRRLKILIELKLQIRIVVFYILC